MKTKKPNLDALIDQSVSATRPPRCHCCNDPALPLVRELMETLHKKNAVNVGVPQMYWIICQEDPGFAERIRYDAFRKHVAAHEPRWLRSKAKAK